MSTDPSAELRLFPLSSPVLEVWFHGLYSFLALLTVWALTFRQPRSRKTALWLSIVVFMYASATVHVALSWWFEITAFTDHGATPGIVNALAHTSVWYKAVGSTMFSLNILIADCIFIWRAWIVWERRLIITIVPILATIAGTVLAIISIVGQVEVAQERIPGVIPLHFVTFSTPYFGMSLATSLLTTGLIALRIFMIQRGTLQAGVPRHFLTSYARTIEIIVETAVIYSLNLLIFVILTAMKDIKLDYPQNIHPQIAGIAPTLLICRVALGHSRPDSEWSTNGLKTGGDLIFAHSDTGASPSHDSQGSGTVSSGSTTGVKDSRSLFPTSATTLTSTAFGSETNSKVSPSNEKYLDVQNLA